MLKIAIYSVAFIGIAYILYKIFPGFLFVMLPMPFYVTEKK